MTDFGESCAAIVRKVDYDRFLSCLFAPKRVRAHLFALYAFNYEVAKTAEMVSEPMAGLIRLQWWRDQVADIYSDGTVPPDGTVPHGTTLALRHAVQAVNLPRAGLEGLIDAREHDLSGEPFANLAAMEAYADTTSGAVMRLAARILGAGNSLDEAARAAGIAYALIGLLRAAPFHAARRRLVLPLDRVRAAGLSQEDVFSGNAPNIRMVTDEIAALARVHCKCVRGLGVPRHFLSALLPAALVEPYARVLTRRDFDLFRHATDLSVPRRQIAMLGAIARGRI